MQMQDLTEGVEVTFPDRFDVRGRLRGMLLSEHGTVGDVLRAYEIANFQQSQNLTIHDYLKSKITIYEHQIMAALRAKNEMNGRVLLADEVGLGKTIEAGILLKEYAVTRMIGNALILTPPSLRIQWRDELKAKFGMEFVMDRDDDSFEGYDGHSWLIASISSASREGNAGLLRETEWDAVVVDEAHRLKNNATLAHRFVRDLPKKFVFLLTATPVQNSLKELYNLTEIVRPGMLGTWRGFKAAYAGDKKARFIKPGMADRLQSLLGRAMIRTTRNEVKKYIRFTDRIPSTHLLAPEPEEVLLYREATDVVRRFWESKGGGRRATLQLMVMQRQISSSTAALRRAITTRREKWKAYGEDLGRILDLSERVRKDTKMARLQEIILGRPGEKHLIFTEFRDTQGYICDALGDLGIGSVQFNGEMSTADRDAAAGAFKRDVQVMVSTEAGGEGQNFQFCNTVVNYDLPWNPMRVEQRVGRVHRIGQEKDVYIHNMAITGSIEEYVLKLLFDKINLFKMTIGDLDLLFEDGQIEKLPAEIFESYMEATTRSERENKFSAIGDRLARKKDLSEAIKEFDDRVFSNVDLSAPG